MSHFLGLAAAFAAILVLKGIPGSCRAGAYFGYDFMVAPSGRCFFCVRGGGCRRPCGHRRVDLVWVVI